MRSWPLLFGCLTLAACSIVIPTVEQVEMQDAARPVAQAKTSTWVLPKTKDALEKVFEFSDPKAFRVIESKEGPILDLHAASEYRAAVRSPFAIALLRGLEFGSFVLEAELLQTGREYGHRDLCLFFGFQKPTRYYYVHIASKADQNAHNVFRVEDAPRTNIAKKTTEGVDWGKTDQWHRVKLERDLEAGAIRVFFDDMKTPIMVAKDETFGWGRVGFGSFDDVGQLRKLRITGDSRPVKGDMFPSSDG